MPARSNITALCTVLVFLAMGSAQAQDIQNFRTAPGTWNGFVVEGALVPAHKEFVPALSFNYGAKPLVVREEDVVTQELVTHLLTTDVMVTVGLIDRLEFSLGLPLHFVKGPAPLASGWTIGDIRFMPKVRLFGLERRKGIGVAFALPISLPTGNSERFVGSDQLLIHPKLITEARGNGFRLAINLGARFRPEERNFESLNLSHELTYGLSAGFELGSRDVVALADAFGAAAITRIAQESRANPLETVLGVRVFTDLGLVFTAGFGTGIIADYGSPVWRGVLGFAWHERDFDRDRDGIEDHMDNCPDVAEDKDGFEDADGCPELDNDQDEIPDTEDRCPAVPEDRDGFEDEDGCPEPDNDNDQILDPNDQCPNKPETYNQWQDRDGCPDTIPDTDGDGLIDTVDKCPPVAEDKDGFEDEDGCPDPDNDKDRILDTLDKCPLEPETVNGYEDRDGCPDERPTRQLVRVTQQKIEILEKVYFHLDKDTIKKESHAVLTQVAEVLVQNPGIKKIRVEGHTDSQASDEYNNDLSQRRAESVKRFLVEGGVGAERLVPAGYWETLPIATNATKEGRAQNRRVEFVILLQE